MSDDADKSFDAELQKIKDGMLASLDRQIADYANHVGSLFVNPCATLFLLRKHIVIPAATLDFLVTREEINVLPSWLGLERISAEKKYKLSMELRYRPCPNESLVECDVLITIKRTQGDRT